MEYGVQGRLHVHSLVLCFKTSLKLTCSNIFVWSR